MPGHSCSTNDACVTLGGYPLAMPTAPEPPTLLRDLSEILLALILGDPLTREEGRAVVVEVLRLRRRIIECAQGEPPEKPVWDKGETGESPS
jgi:hypothetical protein